MTVTRGFQTTIQNLFCFPVPTKTLSLTHVLLLPFITTVWTPVVLAIVNIIYANLKMFMMMMMIPVLPRLKSSLE